MCGSCALAAKRLGLEKHVGHEEGFRESGCVPVGEIHSQEVKG